jgi:putative redox protein
MGEVRLRWTGERIQFIGETGYGDPLRVGGDAEGPGAKPSDLLPLSLVACTAYDVVEILRKQRQDLQGLEAIVTSTQDLEPPWTFRAIHVAWVMTGEVDPQKAARAVDLAERTSCAVAATIAPVVELTHTVRIQPGDTAG